MHKEISLIGVGKYTEVIIELARSCGYNVVELYHYNNERDNERVMGVLIVGSVKDLLQKNLTNKLFAVTVGDNLIRTDIAKKIRNKKGITPNLIHPKAIISPSSEIGAGNFFHFNSVIWTKVTIGNDSIFDPHSLVSHHSTIKNACYIKILNLTTK